MNYIYCGYNPKTVKIPSLLAQYLYGNQRLDLPGIGSFLLDSSTLPALQQSKQRSALLEGVSFESNPACKESPELISFIAEKTGKMKALASADLDSHLQLAQQFLNMGKPYLFEGIGILTKVKAGEFEFTPITVPTDIIKEQHKADAVEVDQKEEHTGDYESFLSLPKTKFEWRKPVIGLFLICGIGVTVWGGYMISKKNVKPEVITEQSLIEQTSVVDSLHISDSITAATPVVTVPANYKYILEVAQKKRALKRYNQLKELRWKVDLETTDSVQFKLFMLLPPSDTTRTMDSLRIVTGRRVYIEYPVK